MGSVLSNPPARTQLSAGGWQRDREASGNQVAATIAQDSSCNWCAHKVGAEGQLWFAIQSHSLRSVPLISAGSGPCAEGAI